MAGGRHFRETLAGISGLYRGRACHQLITRFLGGGTNPSFLDATTLFSTSLSLYQNFFLKKRSLYQTKLAHLPQFPLFVIG
jgi:hypothetical protein